jgi:hypothetical protein
MNMLGLLRMARWSRKPPSAKRVKLFFVVLLLCLALFGIEYIWGWPEALTPDRMGRQIVR